jgi:SAM-dependent methyltransferase
MKIDALSGPRGRLDDFRDTLACPACKGDLMVAVGAAAPCVGCGERFRWMGHTWDLVPAVLRPGPGLWSVWEGLQANGVVSYEADPEHNLAVGDRDDCRAFGEFCCFQGRVLDVGCGPQPWPAYFPGQPTPTRFVGVDPLIETPSPRYLQLRAVAEFLPFRSAVFDQVTFATSLDHFVDPGQALREARRVCGTEGVITLWVGEKRPGAPAPATSPEWYRRLKRPEGAQDLFHLKRLDVADVETLVRSAKLRTLTHERRTVDAYRANHFFRLAP